MMSESLGESVTRLVKAYVAQYPAPNMSIKQAMAEIAGQIGITTDTLYRWRSNRSIPHPGHIERLVEIGCAQLSMGREWGQAVLHGGHHPQPHRILDNFVPLTVTATPHNLPRRQYQKLVGRDREIQTIMRRLATSSRDWIIPLEGIGGIGKSALALEIGWRFVEGYPDMASEDHFDRVIWISAKREELTVKGVQPTQTSLTNMDDIFRVIAVTLSYPAILRVPRYEQWHQALQAISKSGRILFIFDNLETINDDEVFRFLHELPYPAKVLATMRFHEDMPYPIRLKKLNNEAAHEFIAQEARARGVQLDPGHVQSILSATGNIPLAVWWAIGLMSVMGFNADTVLNKVQSTQEDLLLFIFRGVVNDLEQRNRDAYRVLLALAFFDTDIGGTISALAYTVNLDHDHCEECLNVLVNLNLVNITRDRSRYTLLPLTQTYAQAETRRKAAWERKARERWIAWFLHSIQSQDDEWKRWEDLYSRLQEEWPNILLLLSWCVSHRRYEIIKAVWIDHHIHDFTDIYGLWKDRGVWLEWLIAEAEQKKDWSTYVQAMIHKCWTLAQIGRPEQLQVAIGHLEHVWKYRYYVDSWSKCQLVSHLCGLYRRQKNFMVAQEWITLLETSLDEEHADLMRHDRQRAYFFDECGHLNFAMGDYARAEQNFQEVVKIGKAYGWYRLILSALNWLADIAILQQRLDDAELILRENLPVVIRSKNKRRIAYYRRSFALLMKSRGHADKAHKWATDAYDGFERLGMEPEAQEMRLLLIALEHSSEEGI